MINDMHGFKVQCDSCGRFLRLGDNVEDIFLPSMEAAESAIRIMQWTQFPDGRCLCAYCSEEYFAMKDEQERKKTWQYI